MGYRGTKSLSPVFRVQGPLPSLPCIDFDCSAPAIPTVQVSKDSLIVGQHSQMQNSVAVDPSELPSAVFLPAKDGRP